MVNIISDYIPPFSPLPNIAPFTYKDGETYLSTLENLRSYVNTTLVNFINTNISILGNDFILEIATLTTAVNNALATQTTANNASIATLVANVNAQLAVITANGIVANDPVVAAIIANLASASRISLDTIYSNILSTGLYANRPLITAVKTGTKYWATDTQETYFATGVKGSIATAWIVIGSGGNELAFAKVITSQNIPIGPTVQVDITGLTISFVMPERPVIVKSILTGSSAVPTSGASQGIVTRIIDVTTNVVLHEGHAVNPVNIGSYVEAFNNLRILGNPGTTKNLKMVVLNRDFQTYVLNASDVFPMTFGAYSS